MKATRKAIASSALPPSPEYRIQAEIVEYVRLVAPDGIWFHPANGELRDKRTAAKLKWMGVLPGVPDIIGILPPPVGRVLLEVKAPGGRVSEDQDAIRAHCERFEIPFAIVHSVEEAREALRRFGIVTREAA